MTALLFNLGVLGVVAWTAYQAGIATEKHRQAIKNIRNVSAEDAARTTP